jgi:hypothetical protein
MIQGYTSPLTKVEAKKKFMNFADAEVIVDKPEKFIAPKPQERELTMEDIALLDRLKRGELPFEEMQKEVALRVFEKILRNPSSVQVKDWLQSELVKIKKEESQARIGFMEVFIRKMFSGNLPTSCKHCGKPLFTEGEIVNAEPIPNPGIFSES